MQPIDRNRAWLLIAIAAAIAGTLGYALAKWTNHPLQADSVPTAEKTATPDQLQMPESFLQTMGIAVETTQSGDLSTEISAPGNVTAAANGQAVVTSHAAGTLTQIRKRLGEQVKTGEVLALLASRDAAAMTADRATAQSKLDLARSVLQREKDLYEQKVTPRQDFETAQAQLAAAEAEFNRAQAAVNAVGVARDGQSLQVTSPIAGRITAMNAALGAYVEAGVELFRVSDPRFILIEAALPAADARRVTANDAARVTAASGATFDAKVVSVTPALNEQTRSATVTLSIAAQTTLTPGEFVQVRIAPKASLTNSFVVPEEAVQSVDGGDVVFVRTDKGFKLARVVVGARSAGRASILSGLHAGERIATKNAFLLKAELGKGAEEEE